MKNFIFGLFAAVVIGAIAFFAYQSGSKQTNSLPTPTVEPTKSVEAKPTEQNPNPTLDSAEIKQALYSKNNWSENPDTQFTLSTNDGKYASGGVGGPGGGGYFFAVKDLGVWKIVADGNGTIDCASLAPYPDYPTSLIPECYDTKTDNSVKR